MGRRLGWSAAVAALACGLGSIGAGVVGAAPAGAGVHAATRSDSPKAWDPAIAPIVRTVEQLRDLTFDHPVPVTYLEDAAFRKRLLGDDTATAKQKASIARVESQLRAVGLVGGEVDLRAATRTARGEGTAAFYDMAKKEIVIRGRNPSAPLTRVTLAHELTHALQDQHFDILKLRKQAEKKSNGAVLALIEGDATRIQEKYASAMSTADQDAYELARHDAVDAEAIASVPEVIKVAIGAPYALGETMVITLERSGGNASVDRAFRTPPPSDLGFMDPTTVLDGVELRGVIVPPLPAHAKQLGKAEPFGAWGLYLALASRGSATDALSVADKWRGDSSITYRAGGRTCVRVDIFGTTPASTTAIRDALTAWAAGQPALAATVTDQAGSAELTTCDPGAAASAPADAVLQHALSVATARDGLLAGLVSDVPVTSAARCVADALVADPAVDAIVTQADAGTAGAEEFQQTVKDAVQRLGTTRLLQRCIST